MTKQHSTHADTASDTMSPHHADTAKASGKERASRHRSSKDKHKHKERSRSRHSSRSMSASRSRSRSPAKHKSSRHKSSRSKSSRHKSSSRRQSDDEQHQQHSNGNGHQLPEDDYEEQPPVAAGRRRLTTAGSGVASRLAGTAGLLGRSLDDIIRQDRSGGRGGGRGGGWERVGSGGSDERARKREGHYGPDEGPWGPGRWKRNKY